MRERGELVNLNYNESQSPANTGEFQSEGVIEESERLIETIQKNLGETKELLDKFSHQPDQ